MSFDNAIRWTLSLVLLTVMVEGAFGVEGRIVLNSTAMIEGPIVRLDHVATVDVPDADQQRELGSLELMPAPGAERTSYLTVNDVRRILAARGFDEADLQVSGSSRVRLQQAVPHAETAASATAGQRLTAQRIGTRRAASKDNEGMVVAHVVRNVRRGEVLQASDVELRALNVVRQDDNYPSHLESIIGMETTRGLSADRPIAVDDVRAPVIVRRNEVVTVFAKAGPVVVRREMLALGDAGRHELVEVQPLSPQYHGRARQVERFQAQVIGPGEAVVVTGNMQVHGSPMQITLGAQEIN